MSENLKIYESLRTVPESAKKKITGGRLNNMTNISPMWRIKRLTEVFGPVGIGWYTEELRREIIDGANDQKVAIVDINLFVQQNGEWSKPIFGTGGSMLVATETKGLFTSDEAFKMAYTDALSVACKALGMGADVYFKEDATFDEPTKYDTDNISAHSLLAVKKRFEQRLTYLINRGMDAKDIYSRLDTNENQIKKAMSALSWINEKEKELNRL